MNGDLAPLLEAISIGIEVQELEPGACEAFWRAFDALSQCSPQRRDRIVELLARSTRARGARAESVLIAARREHPMKYRDAVTSTLCDLVGVAACRS